MKLQGAFLFTIAVTSVLTGITFSLGAQEIERPKPQAGAKTQEIYRRAVRREAHKASGVGAC